MEVILCHEAACHKDSCGATCMRERLISAVLGKQLMVILPRYITTMETCPHYGHTQDNGTRSNHQISLESVPLAGSGSGFSESTTWCLIAKCKRLRHAAAELV